MKEIIKKYYYKNDPSYKNKGYNLIKNGNNLIFGVKSPKHNIDKVIQDYSLSSNKIIEIIDYDTEWVYTKYYNDYYPLVVLDSCDFYSKEEMQHIAAKYKDFISGDLTGFYNKVVKEFAKFTEHTGMFFSDISANNILVNHDVTDFRIIDVACIRKITENDMSFSAKDIICSKAPQIIVGDIKFLIDEAKEKANKISTLKLSDLKDCNIS